MQIKAIDFRNGTKIELAGAIYMVTGFDHITPGKGRAVIRTKLKNLSTGLVIDRTFGSGENVEGAELENRTMQFLYKEGDDFNFMDNQSYEQIILRADILGNAVNFLIENMQITVQYFKDKPIGVDIPLKIELKIVQTDPAVKGNTVNNATKDAMLETGLKIQIPMFINEGEVVRVDTRDNSYIERVK